AGERGVWVEADPEVVWEVLVDLRSWPRWDDELVAVRGDLRTGGALELVNEEGSETWTVAEAVSPGRLVLESRVFAGALVTRRTFSIEPGEGGSTLTVTEITRGWLSWAMSGDLVDGEGLARRLAELVRIRPSVVLEERLASGASLVDVVPSLEGRYRIMAAYEPSVFLRDAEGRALDEGGLGSWDLVLYQRQGDRYLPCSRVDDGGYDDWGTGREERVVFLDPPGALAGELLHLPPVLQLFDRQDGLLVREDLLDGVAFDPIELYDAFGVSRPGYALAHERRCGIAELAQAVAEDAPLVRVVPTGEVDLDEHLALDLRPLLVRADLVDRWSTVGPLFTHPLSETRAIHPSRGSAVWLGDWQAGAVDR
ncbi:MAG: SRPBCC family protein, partial [Myxococcales bacterium]|nr:SRPBCC family protein [Myxococcales bacterium]